MTIWTRFSALAASLCLMLALHAAPAPADPAPAETALAVADVIAAAHFAEPLVATAPTSAEEDQALARAVLAYEHRAQPDDVTSLTAFLAARPQSGWAAALLTNLGLSYLHYGHFTPALDAWRRAWAAGRAAEAPRAHALVDRAVGELARLYGSLGHLDDLAALFDDIGARPVTGSATEAVQVARELLVLVAKDPRHVFNCGPTALHTLLQAEGADAQQAAFLQWYDAGPDGTSLAEVAGLAEKAKLEYRLVFRAPGQPVPMPAIVHWKAGHFATVVGTANGRIHVEDPVFPGAGLWVTPDALDAEASGYFLVPAAAPADAGWRSVDAAEAAAVWGRGPTTGTVPGDAGDPLANDGESDTGATSNTDQPLTNPPDKEKCPQNGGMCGYNIKESSVGLTLSDTPVGYAPPIGPAPRITLTYNQREDSQPQNFGFFNIGPKWTLNWLGYVIDDPNNPGANVSRYLAGGGAYYYTGYSSATGGFAAQTDDGSILIRTSPASYQRRLRDGTVEVYATSDGSTGFPRRIFLSQTIDPQGNALALSYDGQLRLTSLTDATGRQTTFTYALPGQPLLVTLITDPFNRNARLGYDANGRLASITDVIGLTSIFTYDANSLVNAMTTPYGTTTFAYTAPGTSGPPRFLQVTDPLGYSEREEWVEPASIPGSDNAATVPQGMPATLVNQYLEYRNSFHWDKNAYVVAGCTPTGGCDYTKARIRHFSHVAGTTTKSNSIESVKYPLQNRIWFTYPGQTTAINAGTYNRPTAIGRVLDDGTTQITQYAYDGMGNVTQVIDPLGRTTQYVYAANQVDLIEVAQTTAPGVQTAISQFTFNDKHKPIIHTDAAGFTTSFAYNGAGQLTVTTNPLGETTSYQYDGSSNLSTITNADNATAASFTYDSSARVRTYTDSEGWSITYDYDAADRVTRITYPDGTTDRYAYDRLDLASYQDRQGRVWSYSYDANRRVTAMTDPIGQQMAFGYNRIGKLTSLTDPKTYTTAWTYDVEGRLTGKQYVDTSTVTYAYETTTNRLKSVTDALGQVKQYSYAHDNRLAGIAYLNAVNTTPNVTFADDPWFVRRVSMTDGTGTTQYSYAAPFTAGALQL